jgi:hypothetical protein
MAIQGLVRTDNPGLALVYFKVKIGVVFYAQQSKTYVRRHGR